MEPKKLDIGNHQKVRLREIADIERAQTGKTYEKGATLIALSAALDYVIYLDKPQEVESRYAVVTPHREYNRRYIHEVIAFNYDNFLRQYRTGINLKREEVERMRIRVHRDRFTQDHIADTLAKLQALVEYTERQIDDSEGLKTFNREHMFVGSDDKTHRRRRE